MRILPTFLGYTIDYRLREFRRVELDEEPVFIRFETEEGQRLLHVLQAEGQDRQVVIRAEAGDRDAWVCVCGNRPTAEGFFACDWSGERIEPTAEALRKPLYICDRCRRIINANTLAVVSLDSDAG